MTSYGLRMTMGELKYSRARIRDIFVIALLLTVQLPAIIAMTIFLLYVGLTDEVFNKMLQPYCRRR